MDAVFILLLMAVLGYEGAALVIKKRGDTISEKSWSARDRSLGWRITIDSLVAWLLWHITIDPVVQQRGAGWEDLIFVAAGATWATTTWRKQHG